jgi:hypothetical protein
LFDYNLQTFGPADVRPGPTPDALLARATFGPASVAIAQTFKIPYPDDADFIVLADPDGNLFCVIA